MSRLNRHQKDKLQQFISITDSNERTALAALKASDWNLELAFEIFYGGGGIEPTQLSGQARRQQGADANQLEALFQKYKDPHSDMILAEGIGKLCDDLQVEPSDIVMLVLSYKMQAAHLGEFSKEEFTTGLRTIGVDTAERLRGALPGLRSELSEEIKFRDIYYFAFDWSKEKGQKSLALDTALAMWRLILNFRKWPLTEHWCQFLEERHNKAISRDTWHQLWDFTKLSDLTFSNYDDQGAWPYLIDEFVLYLQDTEVIPRRQERNMM